MKKIVLFFAVLVLCPYFKAAAQEEKANGVQLRWGIAHLARQDLIFSPFAHTDFSLLNVGFTYKREKKLYHEVNIDYSGFQPAQADPYEYLDDGEVKTSAPHFATIVNLNYKLGKKIADKTKRFSRIGGAADFSIQPLNYTYGRISSFGYYAAFSLSAWYQLSFLFKERHLVSGEVAIPLMTWLSRSPYLVNDDEFIENTESHKGFKTFMAFIGDGKLVTWNRLQTLRFTLGYDFLISKRWSIGCQYRFDFIHASRARTLLSYQNTFFLNGTFKF